MGQSIIDNPEKEKTDGAIQRKRKLMGQSRERENRWGNPEKLATVGI